MHARKRYVLVGDPRQLPPIGPGRPFVDIVSHLAPQNAETLFPRCASSYAELTVPRRQTAAGRKDVLLAAHFSGRPLEPGGDEVWDSAALGGSDSLRAVHWSDPQDLQQKIVAELVNGLGLAGPDDELGFELSLGGSSLGDLDRAFFWNRFADKPGAAAKVEAWQVLSPVRPGLEGVDALNRAIQGASDRAGANSQKLRAGRERCHGRLARSRSFTVTRLSTSSTRNAATFGLPLRARHTLPMATSGWSWANTKLRSLRVYHGSLKSNLRDSSATNTASARGSLVMRR